MAEQKEVVRTGLPWSWKYKWPDKLAVKKKLTEKQKAFADEYLRTFNPETWMWNATAAFRASKGTLDDKSLWVASDRANWMAMKNLDKMKEYLEEKMISEAEECLDIQMWMIRDEKVPAAVRTTNIIDRLNRIWVGKRKEEENDFTGIWEITITIKKPEVIEKVEVLDWDKEDGESI